MAKRGRPTLAVGGKSSILCLRLTVKLYEEVNKLASRHGLLPSEEVRLAIAHWVASPDEREKKVAELRRIKGL